MSEKLNKRKQQAVETKNKLTTAIMELMDIKSYHEISIESICERAGVSKGTFYHYFDSKRAILSQLNKMANDEIIATIHFDETKSARQMFEEYLDVIVEQSYKETYANHSRVMIALLTTGENEAYMQNKPQTEYVEKLLRYGQERGELSKEIEIKALNSLITAAIQGFVTVWSISRGTMDLRGQLEKAFSVIWDL